MSNKQNLFAADRMVGRLAKWLRVLGYDVIYGRHLSGHGLIRSARAEGRLEADDIALYGAQIHVVAQDVGRLMEPIAHLLQSGDVQPGQMDVIAPSLEDVFLSCIR